MASLLVARGLQSLIASRDTTASENVAWSALTRRDSEKKEVVSSVLFIVWVLVNIVLFVPVLFVLIYTLNKLYPTLAIVEADSPPDYELVSGKEADVEDNGKVGKDLKSKDTTLAADNTYNAAGSSSTIMPDETAGIPSIPSKPITSSVLATLRLLRASDGGLFKAYRWFFLNGVVVSIVLGFLSPVPYLPHILATIIASLAATKVRTAWTLAVISNQRDGRLWKNLPSYISILKATAIPLAAQAVAIEVINAVVFLPLGPRSGSWDPLGIVPQFPSSSFTRLSIFLVLLFTLCTFLLAPIEVILTRTRASMLPEDVGTLVALDTSIRSLKAEDMSYMSWMHSWRTFSRASWARIVKVYAKIFGTALLVEFVVFGLIGAQVLVYSAVMKPSTAH